MIPNGKPGKHSRSDLVEQIRQLEEKVRALGEGESKSKPDSEGLAQGIVTALGRMVPGLEGLIKIASQMPNFQARLGAIDEEVKRRFKEQPLRQAAAGLGSQGHRQMGIPPSVRRAGGARPGASATGQEHFTPKAPARGKYRQPGPPTVHISPQTPAKLTVDIFDEGPRIVLLAEAPGLAPGTLPFPSMELCYSYLYIPQVATGSNGSSCPAKLPASRKCPCKTAFSISR